MTAPAMAAKLKDFSDASALEEFVDEVTHLVRSQVAAVLGNVAVVFPAVVLLSVALQLGMGQPMITASEAQYVFHSLALLGPSLLFAAFTGVLLFASSIIAGWVENWFVLHRLDSAIRYNPRITRWLGASAGRSLGALHAPPCLRLCRQYLAGVHARLVARRIGVHRAGARRAPRHTLGRPVGCRVRQRGLGRAARACPVVGLGQPAIHWCTQRGCEFLPGLSRGLARPQRLRRVAYASPGPCCNACARRR
jgi:hypothetical protein